MMQAFQSWRIGSIFLLRFFLRVYHAAKTVYITAANTTATSLPKCVMACFLFFLSPVPSWEGIFLLLYVVVADAETGTTSAAHVRGTRQYYFSINR